MADFLLSPGAAFLLGLSIGIVLGVLIAVALSIESDL